ncbi:conserved hypothetical protein [Ricinus communis]|uniref:Uncharacterized protein n=1 Tax=Ricinus communis TaxID=3988 RepID=B9S7X1_RICCO|nr:conserved hypothetical protein [Ricinus communis]
MEVLGGQLHRQPQQRNVGLRSMAEDLDQRVELLVPLNINLQGSDSRNMLVTFHFLLDQLMQKKPCK